MMIKTQGYAAHSATSDLVPFEFARRDPNDNDIVIQILYCGICHSDIHKVRDEWIWNPSHYPMVPGHEIVGKIIQTGAKVNKFKAGDIVGVGCMVDSCLHCPNCESGLEQFCEEGAIFTYGSPEKNAQTYTYGGYSDCIVVREEFVLKISPTLDLARAAPLLCAGITTYSPLKYWKVGPGKKVGIVGIGGLGHMGIKFARAMGAEVIVFTTSEKKREDAIKLGAHEVIVSTDPTAMMQQENKLDFILNTVSANHDVNAYMKLLKLDGVMVMVGLPEEDVAVRTAALAFPRRILTGSGIGGIPETQEMLDFCAQHNILADIEIIPIQKVNEAYERMLKNDIKYRFVIDMKSL